MINLQDQIGNEIKLEAPPRRIVSLVPSQTELLHDLGLDQEVVGITKFCVHPAHWRKEKEVIGGTKTVKIDRLMDLNPDLVIANKEENERAQIKALQRKFPVYVSDVSDLESCLSMNADIGALTGRNSEAEEINQAIRKAFVSLNSSRRKRVVYLIWNDPIMVAGSDTFIDAMLDATGFENLVRERRYPQLTMQQLVALGPDLVMLSSEPYPFKENHMEAFREVGLKPLLVDGELFSWHGSRIAKLPGYVEKLKASLLD